MKKDMNVFKGKKVIVTGGMGFIGSNLVKVLAREGAKVHIIDNLSGSKKLSFDKKINNKIVFHKKDIRKLKDIEPIFKGVDYVFHLAALPRVQYSIEFPVKTFEANVLGTLNVLEAARKMKVSRVVYSASSSAYGDQSIMPLVEDMPPHPKSPYGLQKYQGELMCRMYSEVYGLPTVSLRYFNVYGPGLNPDGAYALVIGKFLKQYADKQPLTITGDGRQTRDFTHVSDVVRANIMAMTNNKIGKGEVINVGAGRDISINKVAELIGGTVKRVPARMEPKNTLADNSKASKLLGWTPTVVLEEGISELKKMWGLN